jgi:hypothetical protein
VYAAFAFAAGYINPLRFVYNDDDFAYARMVQHLLATGSYRTDEWSATTLPFQTAWGALFSLPFGYSPGALRISTIVVFLMGLGAFYQLLRDHKTPEVEAGLLTFVFMASPMAFQLAFGFMTDVHYLGWMLVAVVFYARALEGGHYTPMLLGAFAAFAAVGTRQIGVAFVGALGAAWLFDSDRRKRVLLYLVGLSLPLVAMYVQVRLGRDAPTLTQKLRLAQQADYLADLSALAEECSWRPTVILQYVGWYLVPLLPLFLVHFAESMRGIARPPRPWLLALACGLFFYGASSNGGFDRLMPSLPWLLITIEAKKSLSFRYGLSCATAAFGVLTLWLVLRKYAPAPGYGRKSSTDKLLGLLTAGMLVANLMFLVLGDRYIIVYLPFALWVIGRTARPWGRWTRATVLLLGVCVFAWSTVWTYGRLEPATARFLLAERAFEQGAAPWEVEAGWQWQSYHGAFDAFAGSMRHRDDVTIEEFWPWLRRRTANPRYAITDVEPGGAAVVLATQSWRDVMGRTHTSYLVARERNQPEN